MKKYVSFILMCSLILLGRFSVYAQKMAVKSDIKAYIDYTPIRSYNIDGYTYVIAEELRSYGFDVIWNNDERTLKINRRELTVPIYTKELFDADSDPVSSSYRIYPTDIKTYLNGTEANSFNIGGRTVIQIDELSRCGIFEWDAENREVRIMIYETELQKIYDSIEDKVEILISKEPQSTYVGQVNEDGKPGGIGVMTLNTNTAGAGVGYSKTDKITGFFKDGIPDGKIFLDRYMMAGKVGESISVKFIGTIDSSDTETSDGENNFGNIRVPHHYMRDYMGFQVFPDTGTYLNGVWFENNGYRGQKGVTFRSWYNGTDYQSILKTDLDDDRKQVVVFEENTP